ALVKDPLCALVEFGQQHRAKIDGPDPVVDLLESDPLSDQHSADMHKPLVPLDAAVAADLPDLEVSGVLERRQPLRKRSGRPGVPRGRGLTVESSVRSLVVVDLEEALELSLLRGEVLCRRLGRVVLERLVHPFVSPVLGRLAWLDADRMDPQTDPPHGEPRQATDALTSERNAVVAEDLQGQTVFAEPLGEDSLNPYVFCGFQSTAAEQIATLPVAQRQRKAVPPVPCLELAFEVGAPDVVRFGGPDVRLARMPRPASLRPGLDQAVAIEDLRDRRGRRQPQLGVDLRQTLPQGHRSPPSLAAQLDDEPLYFWRGPVPTGLRRSRPLHQALFLSPPSQPLV